MKRLLVLVAVLAVGAAPQTAGTLRRHPSNPRYFEFRGQPAVLITSGEHYGAVMNLDFDYIPYLNELQARGLNLTRTFSGMYVEGWGSPWNTLNPAANRYLTPWARSGTPGYPDGGNKFDLSQWNAAYFSRLRDFVSQAGQRGIVVELVLFCSMYDDNQWNLSPLKSTNNVNGVGAGPWQQIYNLSDAAVTAVQENLTAKIIQELNGYDNVYYEICNEPYFNQTTDAWHQRIADRITTTEASLPNRHLIAHNISNGSQAVPSPIGSVGILNFHYCSPPDAVAQNYATGRVIAFDETGFRGSGDDAYRKEAWEFLVAGGAVYSNLDWSFTADSEAGASTAWDKNLGGGGPALRDQLRILRQFMGTFNFVAMAPDNGVIQGGVPNGAAARALVESGVQYAIYLSNGTSASLVVNLPANAYRAEWVNTKTGAVDRVEDFNHGGGNRTLVSPAYSGDIALRIKRTGGAPPPPPPPPPPADQTFYRAINLNGPALTIDGRSWEGSTAPYYSFTGSSFENQSVTLSPATDAARAQMIRSSVWNSSGSNVTLTGVPAGRYAVYLYVWEDNYDQAYSISLEGTVVQSDYHSGTGGHWDRLGPWTADIMDGTIQVSCSPGDANLSGIEVWRVTASAPPPPSADSSLIVHWKLDENSGSTAADSSGKGNAGTLSPGGPVWTNGLLGGGLDFGGAGDLLTAPASASLNSIDGPMTAAFWIYKRTNAPTYGSILGRRIGTQWEDLWILFYDNSAGDEYSFGITTSAGFATLTGPASAADRNAWVHLAAVYTGSAMILYRNGAEVARRAHSGTMTDQSSPLVAGGGDNGTSGFGEYIDAILDDVRVYGRALSASEVQTLASAGGARTLTAAAQAVPSGTAAGGGSKDMWGGCGLLGLEAVMVLALLRRRGKIR